MYDISYIIHHANVGKRKKAKGHSMKSVLHTIGIATLILTYASTYGAQSSHKLSPEQFLHGVEYIAETLATMLNVQKPNARITPQALLQQPHWKTTIEYFYNDALKNFAQAEARLRAYQAITRKMSDISSSGQAAGPDIINKLHQFVLDTTAKASPIDANLPQSPAAQLPATSPSQTPATQAQNPAAPDIQIPHPIMVDPDAFELEKMYLARIVSCHFDNAKPEDILKHPQWHQLIVDALSAELAQGNAPSQARDNAVCVLIGRLPMSDADKHAAWNSYVAWRSQPKQRQQAPRPPSVQLAQPQASQQAPQQQVGSAAASQQAQQQPSAQQPSPQQSQTSATPAASAQAAANGSTNSAIPSAAVPQPTVTRFWTKPKIFAAVACGGILVILGGYLAYRKWQNSTYEDNETAQEA